MPHSVTDTVFLLSRHKIKPYVAEERCGFVEGKETSNAIFMLRVVSESVSYVSLTTPKRLTEFSSWIKLTNL